ncbi:TIGR04100 family radical SAM protein [Massilioclostridium coli]|uniref:TIGR04100 family radical SAM protein n=1 Tax=Massilioclostridium coli TaxID=1870991 RepID=UPI0022DF669F|nr:TIGR04100 family radical SAM protein [Massilioclostridium coli]
MTILYPAKNGLYVNLTNRCPCSCTFCLRQNQDGVYGSDSLWLEHEPGFEEVLEELKKQNLAQYNELVFCGYGEPTERLDVLLQVAAYCKRACPSLLIRINTNGLADLIWKKPTAQQLKGLIDTVSISLNAPDAEEYYRLTRSKFGFKSFDAMLQYAKDCTKYVPNVVMTVVDQVTTLEEQQKSKEICDSIGVTLRVRPYEE